MLSSADENLIRRDTALPELRTLLDPEAFVEAIRPHVPEDIEPGSARVVYLKYKPGTNCLAAYKISVGGREVDVYAKTFGPDADVKIENALMRREKSSGSLGPGRIVLEDRAIAVAFFPNDDKLRQLGRLSEEGGKFVERLVPDRPELWDGDLQTLRYKPERRYVARISVGGEPRAVIKLYREVDYWKTRRNARAFDAAFKTTGPFRVVDLIGGSKKHHAVAFEWRDGNPLGDAIGDPAQRTDALETAGAALAELHSQPPGGLRRLPRNVEAETLAELVEPLVFNTPELENRIRSLAGSLAEKLVREAPVWHPIHGDFYEDQVIVSGGAATLLDLDEAASGDPAADLGLFIAHLEKEIMRGRLERGAVAPAAHALLEGYRAYGGKASPEKVRFYTAVGLFRLAPHPFRSREPEWPEITDGILRRSEELFKTAYPVSA
ncbi:MAG: phosphotransferase family protein [Rubrobacteraceae bacterium]